METGILGAGRKENQKEDEGGGKEGGRGSTKKTRRGTTQDVRKQSGSEKAEKRYGLGSNLKGIE